MFKSRRGSSHPESALTEEKVIRIKQRLKQGESQKKLAEEFGVSPQTISNIKHKITWGWL